MTTIELDRIQTALHLRLPAFYRKFMVRFPADRLARRTPAGRMADDWRFTNRPARVIRLNRSVRRRGRRFDGEPWPAEFVVIGRTDRGGYFALNPPMGQFVLEICPLDDKFDDVADSLPAFADWLVTQGPHRL